MMRKWLMALVAALAVLVPSFMQDAPVAATQANHATAVSASVGGTVNSIAAPSTESDFTLDVCKYTNPNTSGYVVSQWDLDVYVGTPSPVINTAQPNAPPVVHQDIRVKCRWVPFATPNYGPLCRIIDRHNNPADIYWSGENYNWRVVIDYWSCPTNPF